MPLRPRLLSIPALAALLLLGGPAGAEDGTVPPSPEALDREPASETLYETFFPVDELVPEGWSPEQQRKLRTLPARLRGDERILLVIRTTVDPIGSREENERWATDLSRAVAARLARSGIPEDRMRVLPGGRGFPSLRRTEMRGVRPKAVRLPARRARGGTASPPRRPSGPAGGIGSPRKAAVRTLGALALILCLLLAARPGVAGETVDEVERDLAATLREMRALEAEMDLLEETRRSPRRRLEIHRAGEVDAPARGRILVQGKVEHEREWPAAGRAAEALPPGEGRLSALRLAGDSLFALEDFAGAETRFRSVLADAPGAELSAEMRTWVGFSMFRRAERMAGEPAAELFGRVAREFHSLEIAPVALFRSGTAFAGAGNARDAIPAFLAVESDSRDAPLALESTRWLARLYESAGDKVAAAERYERLASLEPGGEEKRALLFRAAELFAETAAPRARRGFLAVAALPDTPPALRIVTLFRAAETAREEGKRDEADRLYGEAVKAHRAAPGAAPETAARAYFQRGERRFVRYLRLSIAPPFEKRFAAKQGALEDAAALYVEAVPSRRRRDGRRLPAPPGGGVRRAPERPPLLRPPAGPLRGRAGRVRLPPRREGRADRGEGGGGLPGERAPRDRPGPFLSVDREEPRAASGAAAGAGGGTGNPPGNSTDGAGEPGGGAQMARRPRTIRAVAAAAFLVLTFPAAGEDAGRRAPAPTCSPGSRSPGTSGRPRGGVSGRRPLWMPGRRREDRSTGARSRRVSGPGSPRPPGPRRRSPRPFSSRTQGRRRRSAAASRTAAGLPERSQRRSATGSSRNRRAEPCG